MRKLVIIAIAVSATWWYFIGGRKLSEDHVTDFYHNLEVATLERKPENICALLATDFKSTEVTKVRGESSIATPNKSQTCEAYRELYKAWEKIGEKMGGILQLDSNYTIHSIAISPDKKTATVDISTSLDVAGTIMNIRARSTDTLIRRNGKVLLLNRNEVGSVDAGI